jgi:stress response protein YsnF
MPGHDIETMLEWRGSTVIDRDGDKIGSLKEFYLDQDDRPVWGAVDTGLFGLRQTLIPLADARPVGDAIQVPFEKDRAKDAPNVDPDAQLSEDEERRLYRHYELPSPEAQGAGSEQDDPERSARHEDDHAPSDDARGADGEARGPDDEDADRAPARADGEEPAAEVTRSEEELIVGTRRRVSGKARLKKYVVTEHVQRTIPVQREEVRVEYEPEDEAAGPASPPRE